MLGALGTGAGAELGELTANTGAEHQRHELGLRANFRNKNLLRMLLIGIGVGIALTTVSHLLIGVASMALPSATRSGPASCSP